MTRKPRHLSPEEKDLWDRVAKTTRRQKPTLTSTVAPAEDNSAEIAFPKKPVPGFSPRPFRIGERREGKAAKSDLAASLTEQLSTAPVAMDRKAFGAMIRGKRKPEARIDLHGLTLTQAHPRLVDFILGASARGARLVLVITGKGKDRDEGGPIPERLGKLRHQVPVWLSQAPLAPLVLQIAPAHQRHGGSGAYYVYLRRRR